MYGEEALQKLRDLGFSCQQCGICCLKGGHISLELNEDETQKWRKSEELVPSNFGYRYLEDFIDYYPEAKRADLWFHPDTEDELSRCPFLRKKQSKYGCLIYELRPEDCKYFPLGKSTGEIMTGWSEICPEIRRLTRR
ncbi:YkgJ family cysteine cluster protein [Chloroflexota bacterium]